MFLLSNIDSYVKWLDAACKEDLYFFEWLN